MFTPSEAFLCVHAPLACARQTWATLLCIGQTFQFLAPGIVKALTVSWECGFFLAHALGWK